MRMVLKEHELNSSTWMKIQTHLEERLALLRAKNDASKTIEETEKLRGRIDEVKFMLALAEPEPETESVTRVD